MTLQKPMPMSVHVSVPPGLPLHGAKESDPESARGRQAAIRHRRLAAFLGLMGFAGPALAYLDPSTGSMILSAVIGLFATAGLAVKTYWYKLKGFFRGRKSPPPPADRAGAAREDSGSGSVERDRARTAD